MKKRHLLAYCIAAIAILATIYLFVNDDSTEPNEAVITDAQGETLSFQSITKINGTDIQLLHLAQSTQDSGNELLSKSSDYKGYNKARNILFVTTPDQTPIWLFKDSSQKITSIEQLHNDDLSPNQIQEPTQIVCFVYHFDNTPKQLNVDFTNADGSRHVSALQNIERLLDVKLTQDKRHIDVIYQQTSQIFHAYFDPESFAIEKTQTIGSAIGLPIKP